ncbi:MAG: CHAD domain-containing protein [Candidatus Omnitrophota bacterium]|nr:CHAD domain-containing protein [Candidatus Omnitrophota bacterium]
MATLLRRLDAALAGALTGRGPEHVHRMRVTCRRLRNAVKVFRPFLPPARSLAWDQSLRRLAKLSGQARDLDVHILFLQDYLLRLTSGKERPAAEGLLKHIQKQRRGLQPRLALAITRFRKDRTAAAIRRHLKTLPSLPQAKDKRFLSGLAGRKISKRLKKLLSFEPHVGNPRLSKQLHRTRIAAKHLRYTLEAFRPLYGRRADPFIGSALKIQRVLGGLHDLDVWDAELSRFSGRRALGDLRRHCRQARAGRYGTFIRFWKRCRRDKTWSRLARLAEAS